MSTVTVIVFGILFFFVFMLDRMRISEGNRLTQLVIELNSRHGMLQDQLASESERAEEARELREAIERCFEALPRPHSPQAPESFISNTDSNLVHLGYDPETGDLIVTRILGWKMEPFSPRPVTTSWSFQSYKAIWDKSDDTVTMIADNGETVYGSVEEFTNACAAEWELEEENEDHSEIPTSRKAAAVKKPTATRAPKKLGTVPDVNAPLLNDCFQAMYTPGSALAEVIGSTPMTKTEIVKRLWDYIRANKLQDKKNKRAINADEKLAPLFGKTQVSMFDVPRILDRNIQQIFISGAAEKPAERELRV